MAGKPRKLKVVDPIGSPEANLKLLGQEVGKITKEYTKQVKSLGAKYGMILDVKIVVSQVSEET